MPKVFKAVLVPSSVAKSPADELDTGGGELSLEFRHLLARLAQQHLKELAAVRHEVFMTNATGDVQTHLRICGKKSRCCASTLSLPLGSTALVRPRHALALPLHHRGQIKRCIRSW